MGDIVNTNPGANKRKQIDLPFNQAAVLSDEQLQKLLMLQARRIPVMDWEVQMLVTSCLEKQCMDKGLAILYEYAGHIDNVKKVCDARVEAARRIFHRKGSSDDLDVTELLQALAEANMRVYASLGNWRRLQWSPKSVLCPIISPGSDPQESSRVAIEAALREEGRTLSKIYGVACSRLPAQYTAILLAPCLPFDELANMLNTPNPGSLEPVVCAIRNIISIEDDITTAYRVIRSTTKGKSSPFNSFPILRLVYADYEPSNVYSWFGRALDVYKSSVDVLEAFRKVFWQPSPMSTPTRNTFQVDDVRASSPAPHVMGDFSEDLRVPPAAASTKGSDKGGVKRPAGNRPKSSSFSSQAELDSEVPGAPAVTPSTPQSASAKRVRKLSASGRATGGSFTKTKAAAATPISATRTLSREQSAVVTIDAGIIQVTPAKELSYGVTELQVNSDPDDWIGGGAGTGTSGAPRAASPDIKKRIQRSASAQGSRSNKLNISPSRIGSPLHNLKKNSKSTNQSSPLFNHLSTKTLEALTYINLTKGYSRGEARMESQVLRISLANATIPGEKLVVMAARKIQAWWYLMGPRQLLKRRMRNWWMCKDMVIDVVNASIMQTLKKKRQKAHMLRHGATVTITRLIKRWFYVTRKREAPVGGWKRVHDGGLRGHNSHQGGHALMRVQSSGSGLTHKASDSRVQPTNNNISGVSTNSGVGTPHSLKHPQRGHGERHKDKKKKRWNKLQVAYVLQGFAKIIAAKRLVAAKRKKLKDEKKPRKKKISTFTFKRAATIIQSFFRSSQARIRIFKTIKASLVVNKAYRQHRAFNRLRGDLRRVEKPCRVQIHGIRNLPEQIFVKGHDGIAIRVSCYWSGLLHIFSSLSELKSVVRGKKPQWAHTTGYHAVTKQLTEKELEAEMHAVEAKAIADEKKGLLSRLSRVGGSFIGNKETIKQRKSIVAFQNKNLQKLKNLQTLARLAESESESESEEEEEDDAESPSADSSGVYKPSKFQNFRKKENRTLDREDSDNDMGRQKYCTVFHDELLRLPCIHGNSVLKFEYLLRDGTVFAESSYFCSEKTGLMFWGGEETLQLNYKSISKPAVPSSMMSRDSRRQEIITPEFDLMAEPPSMEFTVKCGIPMMSRVGYSKVKLCSNGPMMNSMYSKFGFFHFFLNTWKKYFLSLDGEGLAFFDTKHCSLPFHIIPVSEITFVAIMQGKPTSSAQAPFEDTHDVILKTVHHETIFLRLSDVGNRVFWHEVLVSCVKGVPAYTLARGNSRDSDTDKNSTSAETGPNTGSGFLSNMTVLGAVGGAANFTHDAVRGSASIVGDGLKNVVGTILPGAFIPGFLKTGKEDEVPVAKSKGRSRSSFVADEIFGKINGNSYMSSGGESEGGVSRVSSISDAD